MIMDGINRELYSEKISGLIGNRNAKIITGIRRCGKSTFMLGLSENISKDDVNRIYIDMELWDNRHLNDPDRLYKSIKENILPGKKNALFLDEIQDVKEWESVIRSLINENICDIYITGSNSRLLSSEYATYLSGRLNMIEMYPLSFRECVKFGKTYNIGTDPEKLLPRYLRFGGFPILWCTDYDERTAYSILQDIISTVMIKDIVSRYGIKNPDILERMFRFICGSLGKYTSLNNIYNSLNTEDRSVSKDTVYAYADHLESSYLIQRANVYDIKGKRVLSSKYKYFLTDLGLKHAVWGYRAEDIPGHMENVLYCDLKSRGYKVWVGENNGKEVDLVAELSGRKVYVQSAFRFSSEKVIEREFGNLRGIDDNHPKYVVTMDESTFHGDSDGIISCSLADFLMKDAL